MTLRLGELCAGYNGLGMAVEEVFGATPAWFSEYDAAPSKILAHHYPNVPNYGDMTAIDWAAIEPADIISGGTPCQDLSNAGKMRGMTEGTRSNLWVQMRQAIAIQQPTYVVWENVRGAFSAKANSDLEHCPRCMGEAGQRGPALRALGRVLGDLSDLGFDAEWRGVRASEVGACHQRYRVFVLAKNTNLATGNERRLSASGQAQSGRTRPNAGGRSGASIAAHGNSEGLEICGPGGIAPREEISAATVGDSASPADIYRLGFERGWAAHAATADSQGIGRPEWRAEPTGLVGRLGAASDSASTAFPTPTVEDYRTWGNYAHAITRWEWATGRPAPRPTEPTGRNGGERLSPRFTEWMMGLPDGWVTDPAIGITRNEQIKACGNGVVPAQAKAALIDMLAAFDNQEVAA
jgi:DNA (cytosine-5)-methyltransferase 1